MMLRKIISGGQTGVDRGALDAALELDFPCGGSCPHERRAEDGAVPERYPLTELPSPDYRARNKQNVIDSDGTLIVFFGELSGGTRATFSICQEAAKPVLTIDGSYKAIEDAAVEIAAFIKQYSVFVLNVAGPRESSYGGAAHYARELLREILGRAKQA